MRRFRERKYLGRLQNAQLSISQPACLVVSQTHQDCHETRRITRAAHVCQRPSGPASGLVEKTYLFFFAAFFAPVFFFVLFLAVFFLAAM